MGLLRAGAFELQLELCGSACPALPLLRRRARPTSQTLRKARVLHCHCLSLIHISEPTRLALI
eukprot:15194491-Alexandrium_andersonii.AAC.1